MSFLSYEILRTLWNPASKVLENVLVDRNGAGPKIIYKIFFNITERIANEYQQHNNNQTKISIWKQHVWFTAQT